MTNTHIIMQPFRFWTLFAALALLCTGVGVFLGLLAAPHIIEPKPSKVDAALVKGVAIGLACKKKNPQSIPLDGSKCE
jgi:hypothetical protein